MVTAILRFVTSLVAGLASFYIAVQVVYLAGRLDQITMLRVDELYRQLLSPVLDLDREIGTTTAVAAGAVAMQAFVVRALFRRWAYRPIGQNDPVARLQQAAVA
ncbi:MAG: hypothetical protein JWO31_2594 [Phycisphaerales bacterium]|nr:hypothetical protein [Phycisphaerales bacterium]